MRVLLQMLTAVAVLATGTVTYTPEASAQGYGQQRRFVERFCGRNPGNRDCREFRRDGRRWDNRRYNRWYRDNRRDDRDFSAAAAIFGFAAGALAGGAIAGSNNRPARIGRDSVARCAARYKTYDPRSNTYIANSAGERRVCNL